MLALCREDPELARTPQVEISICLLCELATQGPFAAIWQRPGDERRLDWLGRPARDTDHDGTGRGSLNPANKEAVQGWDDHPLLLFGD